MSLLVGALSVLAAAFVKGAVGLGFPTLATPLLSLVIDVKIAVAVLIVPNIVMDGIQFRRRGAPMATVRRLALLLIMGGLGTVAGTRLLVILPSATVLLALGCFVMLFVVLNLMRFTPRVPPGWEPWLSPLVGLAAGILGGVTNVHGTTLTMYFYALGMTKHEFVTSVAVSFLTYKIVQLGAAAWYGLLTWWLLGVSFVLTAIGLAGFWAGLLVQDRLDQRTFNRAILAFLAALGVFLLIRAARGH